MRETRKTARLLHLRS